MIVVCQKCGGDGILSRKRCVVCDGQGELSTDRVQAKVEGIRYIASPETHAFITAYDYKGGEVIVDGWYNLLNNPEATDKDGEPVGDCDEFAVTIALLLAGSRLRFWLDVLTFQTVFWLCHSPSNVVWWKPRHVVLWTRKHGWIDSTERYWRDTPAPHKKRLPLPITWVALRMLMGRWHLLNS